MKRYLLLIGCLTMVMVTMAQQITGRAPSQVAVGEQFRLSYTVNTDDVKGFRAGNIPEEFDVLMGPSTSTGEWPHVQFVISHLYLYLISQ